MNSIVFQEMRESRGLAYSAWAGIVTGGKVIYPYTVQTQIATQNDKMMDAIKTFNDIINNMPESEAAFKLAKKVSFPVCAPTALSRIISFGHTFMLKIWV